MTLLLISLPLMAVAVLVAILPLLATIRGTRTEVRELADAVTLESAATPAGVARAA